MAAVIWIVFGLLATGYVLMQANADAWSAPTLSGIGLGAGVGIAVTIFSLVSLKRLSRKPDGTALQSHMMLSFGIKLIAAIVLAVVIEYIPGENGPWADLETCLVSFIAVVFFGFALQGNLLEAASGSNGLKANQGPEPPDDKTEK